MFLDTSALVPLYVPEADSVRAEAIVAGSGDGLVASELALAELTSALLVKEKNQFITSNDRELILRTFEDHVAQGFLMLVPVNGGLVREAVEVMRQIQPEVLLRTLDAIHLATYMSVDAGLLFTRDRRMIAAAQKLGLTLAG